MEESRSFASLRMTGGKGERMTGGKGEGMTGSFLLFRQDLSRDAPAGEGGIERGERAVERRTASRGDFGAERGAVDDLGGPRLVAHDDGLRRLLDVEQNVVHILERPHRRAVRRGLLVALQAYAGQPEQAVVVRLELGPIPVLPDAVARRE